MKQFPKSKILIFGLLTIMLSIVGTFAVAEIFVRVSLPASVWRFRDATTDWQLDARLGWVQKANLDDLSRSEVGLHGWTVHFRTNEDGLTPHTAQPARAAERIRIMFFGDSTVVGRAVPQDKTIHFQLEKMLRSKGIDAEVVNAGVQGYSTDQALLRIQQLLPIYRPDVVLYALCSNDFGGNVSSEAYGVSKPMYTLRDDGVLVEIPPDVKKGMKIQMFGNGPRKWIQHSALYRSLQPQISKLRASVMGWKERNLLGLAPEMYYRPEALEEIDWTLLTALLREMDSVSRKNGAKFVFFAHPAIEEVWNPYIENTERQLGLKPGEYDRHALENRLQHVATQASIRFSPMIDYFLANQSRGPFHLIPRDPHSNPTGYELQAEVISRFLIEFGLLAKSPGKSLMSSSGEERRY